MKVLIGHTVLEVKGERQRVILSLSRNEPGEDEESMVVCLTRPEGAAVATAIKESLPAKS